MRTAELLPPHVRRSMTGVGWIVVLVAAAAAWLSQESTGSVRHHPASVETTHPPVEATSGFSAEYWSLPDDPLLGFVEIPAGPFVMGSDPTVDRLAYANELWSSATPQARVEVPTFFIGRYEVTKRQFQVFRTATAGAPAMPGEDRLPDHPVVGVSWPDALAYARWLDDALRTSQRTPTPLAQLMRQGFEVTLPTEAQWEKAARGTDGRIYPWGLRPDRTKANYGSRGTTPVGTFACPECPYGLADMSGNVWELTRSPYQPYPYSTADDLDTLATDALWVMRGGHYGDTARQIRAAIRGGADPGVRREFIGFRLVLTRPADGASARDRPPTDAPGSARAGDDR